MDKAQTGRVNPAGSEQAARGAGEGFEHVIGERIVRPLKAGVEGHCWAGGLT